MSEQLKQQPAFKVITPAGHVYAVYRDGHIEGFEPGCMIVNYIPNFERLAVAQSREQSA